MAAWGRDPGGFDCFDFCHSTSLRKKEVEEKPEKEEGIELWREAATTTKQLRGRIIVVPNHSLTKTDSAETAADECSNYVQDTFISKGQWDAKQSK